MSLEFSKDDHVTIIVLGIVQGQPYERLWKISHTSTPQSFIIRIWLQAKYENNFIESYIYDYIFGKWFKILVEYGS
jgi:hypothetical protein